MTSRLPCRLALELCAAIALGASGAAQAATVTVDGAVEYQTIDGFGGAESWRKPPASMHTQIFDDLGVSILRFQMFAYTESTPDQPGDQAADNDNDDPFSIDWNGVNTNVLGWCAALLQAAQSRGVKIIGTTWSPPAWMKDNNLVESSSTFKAGYEDELVEFIEIWVKGMELYHGVHIDSVTIQNEPDNLPPWPGCKYTPAQLRDIIKLLGARFAAEGITTEIHAPDVTSLNNFNNSYADTICQDSVARGYVDRLATHAYWSNFVDPDSHISGWTSAHNLASGYGKPLWQTEYTGNGVGNFQNDAFVLVQHTHNALAYGHVSAWLCYELYKDGGGSDGVMGDSGPYPRFYTLKHYFRYVRPGAVRIEATCADANLLVTAFQHGAQNTVTLVMINRDATAKTVDCSLSNLSGTVTGLSQYRTSSAENCIDVGPVAVSGASFSAALPAESITTFTGTLGAVNNPPTAAASANPTSVEVGETVALDGSSSTDPDGDALSYSWDFDDGKFDTGVSPTHYYSVEGTYTVTLTVDDGRGGTDPDTVQIIVTAATDSDGDGLPDAWELTYFSDVADCVPGDHSDGDGLTNAEEYAYGTDPTNSDTDSDRYSDSDEIAAGTDPLDETDHPVGGGGGGGCSVNAAGMGGGVALGWALPLLVLARACVVLKRRPRR